ncbi:MAG: M16 family metallopeptidase [Pirellula sp.]|jgi:predicted Zn-dependent peptidase
MEFRSVQLDNGLEIVAEINPSAFSQSLGYFVKAGSRDETPKMAGVSHFLEHMVFKGTAKRSAEDVNQELDDLGSQSNAYTSEEQTVYYMSVLPENQAHALELLSDIMRPALRDDDFETEKQVIIEEIAMYDDQPPYGAVERAMEEFFSEHPLARRVLGTRDTVLSLDPASMREYHQSRYAPNNLTLVAAGAVQFDELVESAKRLTASWSPMDTSRSLQRPKALQASVELVHPPATQQYTLQHAMGVASSDNYRYVLRVLASILGDDSGSRLFWALVDNGLAESAVVFTQEFDDCGLFSIYTTCAPEQHESNWDVIQNILASGAENPVTDREIELAKNKICSGLILSSERPSNRLFSVGGAWLKRERYETVAEVAANYQRVTRDQLQDAFEKLKSRSTVTVTVHPE